MPFIETHKLQQGQQHPDQQLIYNGLDCCLTFEIFQEISRLYNQEPMIYNFERALQAPALEMMQRGFRIDETERRKGTELLNREKDRLDSILQRFAFAVWGKGLNPRSPKQLKDFFYGSMRLPEQWSSQKGERKLSMNRETLEKLEVYFHARPIIAAILSIREKAKQLEVFETEIYNGRMRFSINIAGTETGRWSTNTSVFGDGRNIQNIERELRKMFIADEGYKLCHIDLEQAESRECGWLLGTLFGDWSYLDACESGDLHTAVCKLIWKNLGWTGDPKVDREIAEQIFYRHFSYRDMAKRGGHGSNYYGTAFTMARHLKVLIKLIQDFQEAYFDAFPGFPQYHRWCAQQLETNQSAGLITPFGRRRHFFGRPNDDTTLREAIAFLPQSMTADRTNLGLWRVWDQMRDRAQLLAQGHDAITFQYRPEHGEAEIIATALELVQVWLEEGGRRYTVPGEAKTGWNWAETQYWTRDDAKNGKCSPSDVGKVKDNPNGLQKWKGKDDREKIARRDMVM